MHTDQTLALLDGATALLGVKFRHFVNNICRKFNTHELQREANARARRAAKKSSATSAPSFEPASQQADSAPQALATVQEVSDEHHSLSATLIPPSTKTKQTNPGLLRLPAVSSTYRSAESDSIAARRTKTFNLDTYKYHSLGDYVEHIQQYGTPDSYSTEPVRRSRVSRLVSANYS
jgi:hypothetical protein